jgi:hypothetical protein
MRIFLVYLVSVILLMNPTPALAIFGIGIHGGVDNFTVDGFNESFKLDDNNEVSLVREEISSPIMFGCNFIFDALPIIDLGLSIDACLQDYKLTYTTPLKTQDYDATFGRIGIYGTVRKNLISFPPVISTFSLYTGAGLGLHLVSPIVGKKLIQEELNTIADPLKPDDITDKLTRVGGHILLGAQFKPPAIPIMINADAKYTIIGEGDYEEPGSFLSIYVSLGLNF